MNGRHGLTGSTVYLMQDIHDMTSGGTMHLLGYDVMVPYKERHDLTSGMICPNSVSSVVLGFHGIK
jgi:hypothetical protein